MESKFNKIGLFGASGTGKTTLAKHISETYKLPYVNSSSSKLWGKYGYKTHQEVHEDAYLNPTNGIILQREILESRNCLFKLRQYFITDRTPVDQMAYFMYYFPFLGSIQKLTFIDKLKQQVKYFDAFIFVEFNTPDIEDNGKRVLDPVYQVAVDGMMQGIVKHNLLDIQVPILVLPEWDWEKRKHEVEQFLASI